MKTLSELLDDCAKRGIVMEVKVMADRYPTAAYLDTIDRFTAAEKYGEYLVSKYKRRRDRITVYII